MQFSSNLLIFPIFKILKKALTFRHRPCCSPSAEVLMNETFDTDTDDVRSNEIDSALYIETEDTENDEPRF